MIKLEKEMIATLVKCPNCRGNIYVRFNKEDHKDIECLYCNTIVRVIINLFALVLESGNDN